MEPRMEILNSCERYRVRNVLLATGVTGLLEGEPIQLDSAGKGIKIGSTAASSPFTYLVYEEDSNSPGTWPNAGVAVIEIFGHLNIRTTVYNAAKTYAIGSALTLVSGKWDLATFEQKIFGYAQVLPASQDAPMEIQCIENGITLPAEA